MSRTYNILIACGGTGGHLFPGIAIAQELQAQGHRATLLISRKEVDAEASDKYADLTFHSVPAIAKPKLFSPQTPSFVYRLISTYLRCKKIIKQDKIDIVLGMGGFTTLPPVRAAHKMGLKCYIHEANAIPGKANRLTARWCNKVFIGMQEAAQYLPSSQCQCVGTPARAELYQQIDKQEARQTLGLPLGEEDTLILTIGGSQGAVNLNTRLLNAAKSDPSTHYLIIAGKNDQERVEELAKGHSNIHVLGFCAQMVQAYAASDGVIARAGASTLGELAELGKASLLVPYPFAADDHQSYNARAYADKGAAQLCPQQNLSPERIHQFVNNCVKNKDTKRQMEENMKKLAHPQAAKDIAAALIQEASQQA